MLLVYQLLSGIILNRQINRSKKTR